MDIKVASMSWILQTAMNSGVHAFFQTTVFSGYMPKNGIAGSYGSSNFFFFKEIDVLLYQRFSP